MPPARETYPIEIAGLHRDLPIFEVQPGLRIAVLNILGDTELVQACAKALALKLADINYDLVVTAEAKSIPLVHSISVETGKPYVILRKTYQPYMGVALSAEAVSITTGDPQLLYMDERDHALARGKRVILLDDVFSTGSTLHGMHLLMAQAGAKVVAEAAILTEGDQSMWSHVMSLGHIPVFKG